MTETVKDSTKTINDASTALSGSKRKKLTRIALTLREKAIVKSFCEQIVNDCKARGESVPSQEALRREVATQFGWTCGRSTLSKILSMNWKALRSSQEGGEAPRNPDMKRRRRPLFPAFEADLLKFVLAQLEEESEKQSASSTPSVPQSIYDSDDEAAANNKATSAIEVTAGRGQRRILTEALILKEAQRLKKVHGVSDTMLVLSVGWLHRFKHRNCIRLRKPARTSNKCSLLLQHQLKLGAGASAESKSVDTWGSSLIASNVSDTQSEKEQAMPQQPYADHTVDIVGSNANPLPISIQHSENEKMRGNATQGTIFGKWMVCSLRWHHEEIYKPSRINTAFLEQIPESIRKLACSCRGSAICDELFDSIVGLRVAVVGFGSVVEAFLTAAMVGANGFVTCVEASPENVCVAEQISEHFCLVTLGLPAVNMKFVVGEYGRVAQSSSSCVRGDELKQIQGQTDLVICNCSIQSLEFPASKNAMLGQAFSLLKVGGELRVADLVCSRRLSASEFSEAYDTCSDCISTLLQQKLLLSAPYIGDLRRLFQALGSDVEVRSVSCKKAEAAAIDVAVASLLPTLAAVDNVSFRRVTFRVFQLQDFEDPREDYGETAVFNGYSLWKAGDVSTSYQLDDDFDFQKGVCTQIDGNTARILQTSWMRRYFSVRGSRSSHRGPFVASKYSTKCPSPASLTSATASTLNSAMR